MEGNTSNSQSSTDQSASNQNPRRKVDPAWNHCIEIPATQGKAKCLRCIHCDQIISGGGINRMKQHLAGITGNVRKCPVVNGQIRHEFLAALNEQQDRAKKNKRPSLPLVEENESEEAQNSLETDGSSKKKKTNEIGSYMKGSAGVDSSQPSIKAKMQSKQMYFDTDMAFATWMYDACIPLNAVNSPYFAAAITRIASMGHGYTGPSYHALRINLLKEAKVQAQLTIDALKTTWATSGCTIMGDGWSDRSNRSLINFMVYCHEGISFIKSVDVSTIVSSAENLCKLFCEIVEFVGVKNVVHMVTDNASNYKKAGTLLSEKYPSIFWSPCSAHCINLILKDICELPHVKKLAHYGSRITVFVYNRKWAHGWLKQRPGWTEIVAPGTTRFGTTFIALKSLCDHVEFLEAMVIDAEFKKFAKDAKAEEVKNIILDRKFWVDCNVIVKVMSPIMKLLRMCDADEKPSLGYVFEGMDRAINGIKELFKGKERNYKPYVDIINERWDRMLRRSLHGAAYYLNPIFHYAANSQCQTPDILKCMYEVFGKLVPGVIEVVTEMMTFHNRQGSFGQPLAIKSVDRVRPDQWWFLFGGDAPNLQKIAIKILSQTSSSSGCERNWSVFERIHTKKRNRLEHERLSDLVFVHYNLRLKRRGQEKNKSHDPIDYECIDRVDEWIVEENPSEDLNYNELEQMLVEEQENATTSQPSIGDPSSTDVTNAEVNLTNYGMGISAFGLYADNDVDGLGDN